jgi:hypothetical protein
MHTKLQEKKRPLEGPKRRWMDNTEIILESVGYTATKRSSKHATLQRTNYREDGFTFNLLKPNGYLMHQQF